MSNRTRSSAPDAPASLSPSAARSLPSRPPRRPPGRPRHRRARSSSSAARPSRTPVRRCSTAISASPRGRRSSASASPPWSTAPPTPTTPSPRRRRPTSPPPTTSRPGSRSSPANDLTGHGPRQPDADRRAPTATPRRAQLTGALTLDAAGRPQRAVRLRDRLGADHRLGQLGPADQRRLAVQRLLAGRQLGHARHHHGVPGQPDGAHVDLAEQRGHGASGGMLARNGQVSLINNVIDGSMCGTSTSAPITDADARHARHARHPRRSGSRRPGTPAPAARTARATRLRPAAGRRRRPAAAPRGCGPPRITTSRRPGPACTDGFRATVRGRMIRRVVFSLDGRRIGSRTRLAVPRVVRASARPQHTSSRRASRFKDATRAKTLTFRYRACAAQVLQPAPAARRSSPDEPASAARDPPARAGGSRCWRWRSRRPPPAGVLAAPARAAGARVPASQPLVVLLHDHVARTRPSARARRIESVAARRPLTRVRTVLPVIGRATSRGRALAGCASGSPGGPTDTRAGSRPRRPRRSGHRVAHRRSSSPPAA